MIVDIFTPQKMKRWLMEAYRPIRWDNHQEVTEAFYPLGLVLKEMQFQDGLLELRFIVNHFTTESPGEIEKVIRWHGGELVNSSFKVEHNVRRLQVSVFQTMEYRGRQEAEFIAWVVPLGARRNRFTQALVDEAVRAARIIGQAHNQRVVEDWV